MIPPLDDWLTAAKSGDQRAFAQIYRALQPAVVRYLRVAAGPHGAEDLAADTWYEVARGLGRFEGDAAGFRAWVFTIARLRLLDWRRASARRPFDPTAHDDLPERVGGVDPGVSVTATDEALRLIALLPADQAEVVALRAVAGLDVAQVAELLGKRPGAVRVAAHRGLRRLAALVAEEAAEKSATGV